MPGRYCWVESGDWGLEIGEWRLEIGDWRLETGDWRLGSFVPYLATKIIDHFQ